MPGENGKRYVHTKQSKVKTQEEECHKQRQLNVVAPISASQETFFLSPSPLVYFLSCAWVGAALS